MLIADGHVHIYDCYDVSVVLDSALTNFNLQLCGHAADLCFCGVLLLAEKSPHNWFAKTFELLCKGESIRHGNWLLENTRDECTIQATGTHGDVLFLVTGRQVNSAEGLEVLSLASTSRIEEGLALEETLDSITSSGGIGVLPWAFGKWFGKRGKKVEEVLTQRARWPLFLGDNGGRPKGFYSRILGKNTFAGHYPILPGSDPLPLKNEEKRIGSYGFLLDIDCRNQSISAIVKKHLVDLNTKAIPYGRRIGIGQFVKNQLLIRTTS